RFRWAMKRTQKQHDNQGYASRKQTMDYDESSKKQRNLIYSQRDELISEDGEFKFNAEEFILKYLDGYLAEHKEDFTRNELSR
ncbi:hypothetical protein, partial [Bacillus velezensis]